MKSLVVLAVGLLATARAVPLSASSCPTILELIKRGIGDVDPVVVADCYKVLSGSSSVFTPTATIALPPKVASFGEVPMGVLESRNIGSHQEYARDEDFPCCGQPNKSGCIIPYCPEDVEDKLTIPIPQPMPVPIYAGAPVLLSDDEDFPCCGQPHKAGCTFPYCPEDVNEPSTLPAPVPTAPVNARDTDFPCCGQPNKSGCIIPYYPEDVEERDSEPLSALANLVEKKSVPLPDPHHASPSELFSDDHNNTDISCCDPEAPPACHPICPFDVKNIDTSYCFNAPPGCHPICPLDIEEAASKPAPAPADPVRKEVSPSQPTYAPIHAGPSELLSDDHDNIDVSCCDGAPPVAIRSVPVDTEEVDS